ncbi:MAG: PLP-dependent aminotransferase family protein [Planctomycetes bacterium]|nr:PLP-dependent aminotransferase family protein [Planctomycetota bacterium]
MTVPLELSTRAHQTEEPPISYFIQQAVENPNLISLAAGLVDPDSTPIDEVKEALESMLRDPQAAKDALQYGTTQGYGPLREKILRHVLALDQLSPNDVAFSADDVVITTGSQQLLYLIGEILLNPGDIVITEAPSYFVYHGILGSLGIRTLTVPMDEQGMKTDELESLLTRLEQSGELARVKLIYTVDYFQNPTGLTLSMPRRQELLALVQRFSKSQRILILEDAAYRELRFDGVDVPSLKSLDRGNEWVILGLTFSKPLAPGLKTGYGILPRELMAPLLRIKGNHDFGSNNFTQHLIDRMLRGDLYQGHVERLRMSYRAKRNTLVNALAMEFPRALSPIRWTTPEGGMYVWLRFPPEIETGPGSRFMEAALREGVLYVPGAFCYAKGGPVPNHEARLCYGDASHDELREAVRRLGKAAREVLPMEKITIRRFGGCG